jgi:hypothetical protein
VWREPLCDTTLRATNFGLRRNQKRVTCSCTSAFRPFGKEHRDLALGGQGDLGTELAAFPVEADTTTASIFALKSHMIISQSNSHAGNLMQEQRGFLCSICFKPVNLNQCKLDELGRPVHEDCYQRWLLHMPPKKKVQGAGLLQNLRTKLRSIIGRR